MNWDETHNDDGYYGSWSEWFYDDHGYQPSELLEFANEMASIWLVREVGRRLGRKLSEKDMAHVCNVLFKPIDPWPKSGGVYIARMPRTDYVKIGKAKNVARRLGSLLCGFPEPYELLAVVPGYSKEETELHRRFAANRERRGAGTEWFRIGPDLSRFLCETAAASVST